MVFRRILAITGAAALLAQWPLAVFGQQKTASQAPTLHATTELVLVNVVARDKKGNLIRDLKREDFTVLEDGQKQQVASFDFENIDELALAGQAMPTAAGTEAGISGAASSIQPVAARDRRSSCCSSIFPQWNRIKSTAPLMPQRNT